MGYATTWIRVLVSPEFDLEYQLFSRSSVGETFSLFG